MEIMRTGHLGRWAAVTAALLLTGACSQATGLAGVNATSPSTANPNGFFFTLRDDCSHGGLL
ncbi:hypothetical protein ACWDX9_25200, partial [Nonomuraea sp. NPDC003201]